MCMCMTHWIAYGKEHASHSQHIWNDDLHLARLWCEVRHTSEAFITQNALTIIRKE